METLAAAYPEQGTQPITVITPTGRADATLRRGPRPPGRRRRRTGAQRRRLDGDLRHGEGRAPVGGRDRHHQVPAGRPQGLLHRRPERRAARPGGHQRPGPAHRRTARRRVRAADPDRAAAQPGRPAAARRRRDRGVGRVARHRRPGLRTGLRVRGDRSGARPAVVRLPRRPRRRLRHLPHAPDAGGVPVGRRTGRRRAHRAADHRGCHRLRRARPRRDLRGADEHGARATGRARAS